jgi:hypothetical protein
VTKILDSASMKGKQGRKYWDCGKNVYDTIKVTSNRKYKQIQFVEITRFRQILIGKEYL